MTDDIQRVVEQLHALAEEYSGDPKCNGYAVPMKAAALIKQLEAENEAIDADRAFLRQDQEQRLRDGAAAKAEAAKLREENRKLEDIIENCRYEMYELRENCR